jgi:hypothetical protein
MNLLCEQSAARLDVKAVSSGKTYKRPDLLKRLALNLRDLAQHWLFAKLPG